MGLMAKLVKSLRSRSARPVNVLLAIERLETRTAPALLASQVPLALPNLTTTEVQNDLALAAQATASDDAIVAIVDRNGNILGVRVEGNVSPAITGNPQTLIFAIDGAVAEARTGAFFASDAAPLTSRTIQFISQSTISEREVDSDPNIADPNSPLAGPGLVAPIGVGGNFPPGVNETPQVDLSQIELTNRDTVLNTDGGTDRFNLDTAFVPAGQALSPVLSYGDAILTPAELANPNVQTYQGRGIGTLPGGIPLYKDGELVGGIGVFFPGTTGYASEENSSLSSNYDPSKPDLSLEAEFIAFSVAGPTIPADLANGRIDLAGITLPIIGPGSPALGISNLTAYADANFAVDQGDPNSGVNEPVDSGGDLFKAGKPVPSGWLVLPHAGVNISAAQVLQIIQQGIATANQTRAQIRLPVGDTARMVFAVADSTGAILGLYRMPDATVFSIDVAVAKARNTAYYDDSAQLQAVDEVPGVPAGASLTARTFQFLSNPFLPDGITGAPPGPFSILNAPGINQQTALNTGAALPASDYDGTVVGYDAFHPGTNFHAQTIPQNQNGVVFFPGSSGVYGTINGNTQIVGGFGVSGDGVDEDDTVTVGGVTGFGAPSNLTADQFTVRGVRLPYFNLSRNPFDQ